MRIDGELVSFIREDVVRERIDGAVKLTKKNFLEKEVARFTHEKRGDSMFVCGVESVETIREIQKAIGYTEEHTPKVIGIVGHADTGLSTLGGIRMNSVHLDESVEMNIIQERVIRFRKLKDFNDPKLISDIDFKQSRPKAKSKRKEKYQRNKFHN